MHTKTHLISMWKHTLHPYLMLLVTLKSVTMIVELHSRLLRLFQWSGCCGRRWMSLKPRFSWRASLTHIIRCIQTIHTKNYKTQFKVIFPSTLGLSNSLFFSDFINTICDTHFSLILVLHPRRPESLITLLWKHQNLHRFSSLSFILML